MRNFKIEQDVMLKCWSKNGSLDFYPEKVYDELDSSSQQIVDRFLTAKTRLSCEVWMEKNQVLLAEHIVDNKELFVRLRKGNFENLQCPTTDNQAVQKHGLDSIQIKTKIAKPKIPTLKSEDAKRSDTEITEESSKSTDAKKTYDGLSLQITLVVLFLLAVFFTHHSIRSLEKKVGRMVIAIDKIVVATDVLVKRDSIQKRNIENLRNQGSAALEDNANGRDAKQRFESYKR